jgi:hypothetical protein
MTFTATVTTTVTPEQIRDTMVSAFEGGTGYWCFNEVTDALEEKYVTSKLKSAKALGLYTKVKTPWYDNPAFWADPEFAVTVELILEDDGREKTVVGPAEMQKGIQVMAEVFPDQFQKMTNQDGDSVTADIFWQCVVLGDEVALTKNTVYG